MNRIEKISIIIILLLLSVTSYSQDGKPDKFYKAMEVTYVGLNAIDLTTTYIGLNNGAVEANPLYRNSNPYLMLGTKMVFTSGFLVLNRLLYKENPKAAKVTIIVASVLTTAVVANNINVVINLNR